LRKPPELLTMPGLLDDGLV